MRLYAQPSHDAVELTENEMNDWEIYRATDLRTRSERMLSVAKWTAGAAFIFGGVVSLEALGVINPYQ